MSLPVPPLRENDLPKREKSFWKMSGPGAVMIGLSIGSGEMILWPWITAKFGADMVWAAALGVFIQLWLNFEIGRWAVATGESMFTGYARLSKIPVYYFMTILAILALLPAWARTTGLAMRMMIFGQDGPGADWMWTLLVFAIVFAVLFGPKRIYTAIERVTGVLVAIIVVGMIVVAVRIGTFADVAEMSKGLLKVGQIRLDDELTPLRLFGAVVFAGAGGFGNLYYAYYLRDKGIGMGAHIAALTSPLRGGAAGEHGASTGFVPRDSEENRRRFRDWFKWVVLDQSIYFWLLNTFTMFLFMFGAFVVLYPQGIVPSQDDFLWDLSLVLQSTMGTWGRPLFLMIAMAAMLSTQLAASDGGYRLWTDLLHTNFRFARRWAANQWYLFLALTLMTISTFSTWVLETFPEVSALDFFFYNAVLNGFAMAVYVPLILVLNFKYLPPSMRPKPLNVVMVLVGAATYGSFAIYTLFDKITGFFG
jgi:Mn2+/Fe2+ NRAMP family transporter